MKTSALIAQARCAKVGLELVRDELQDAGALAKMNAAVRALAAVNELIYALDDGERAEARAKFRGDVERGRTGPGEAPESGPGPGPDGPGEAPGQGPGPGPLGAL
jgi:hypothetical protein